MAVPFGQGIDWRGILEYYFFIAKLLTFGFADLFLNFVRVYSV
tara:strand:+ start:26028 stop:26156 length:129 start_codon:yes stop_codon:yes gene_type:complete